MGVQTALGQDNTDADNADSGDNQEGSQDNNQDNQNQDNADDQNQDNANNSNENGDNNGDDNNNSDDNGDGDNGDNSDQVAPDEYADFELAEGTEINAETLTGFKELAKAANLTQDQAQKFVDMQQAQQTAQADQLITTGAEWLTAAKSHFGESKFDEATAIAGKGLEYMFGDDSVEIKQVLNNTQLGNNVAFIKAFHKIGEMVSEGTFIPGSQGQHTKKTAAQVLYPSKE